MLMLIIGVVLWSGAHLFERLAPAAREGMGDLGKLIVTVTLAMYRAVAHSHAYLGYPVHG